MMGLDKESVESSWSCITNSNSAQNQPQSPFQSPNSGGSSSVTFNYSPKQQQNRTSSPRNPAEEKTCYLCKKQGHWVKHCPILQAADPDPDPDPGTETEQPSRPQPCESRLPCHKCGGTARLQTSKSKANPNRQFFKCFDNNCFVNWFDEVETNEIIYVPICKCKAGFCRLSTRSTGPNTVRKCLVCPIKKGQGACDFLQWIDDSPPVTPTDGQAADERISTSPPSTLTNCDDHSPASSSDLVHEGNFSSNKEMETESTPVAVVDTPPHGPQNHGSVSGQSKRSSETIRVEFDGEEEDTSIEPLRKHHKRLRHGGPEIDCSVLDFDTECLDAPTDPLLKEEIRALVPRTNAEINRRQIIEGFPGPSASYDSCSSALENNSMLLRQNCLLTAAMGRNIGFHVGDWLGRLQFSPSRGLMIPAPKLLFCYVFPSFNPISVPQNGDKFEGIVYSIPPENPLVSPLCSGQDSQLSSFVHWEPSRVVQSSVMKDAVSESFEQTAMKLQKKLLALLESKDFHDHKSMAEEANTTFEALDRLLVNFQPFREHVKEFISRASSLAELERSISNDRSSKELVEWYNREKKRLDDVTRDHAKAIADLDASKQRIKLLDEKAASVRDMLLRIETELVCCRAENEVIESKFVKISKAKGEREKGFQIASEAAGGALKLYHQREEDLNAAEAAFKKAKILLRQH